MIYDANSIETLSFLEAIRTRVAMYMGSADNQGVIQCVKEIITNSIDEATMGFGKEIRVKIDTKLNCVRVEDDGRGVPFGVRDDGIEAMEAVYTMAHSGAKFNDKIFQNVGGMNGIGAKGVALSSTFFKAISFRGGKCATLILKDGVKISFEITDAPKDKTGTIVEFVPAQEVYNLEPIKIDTHEVLKMCRDWSFLMKGLCFKIEIDEDDFYSYVAKNGLIDMLAASGKRLLHRTPMSMTLEDSGAQVELVMGWTDSREEEWHVYTNGLENVEGGTPLTGIKTALTNFFKKKLKGEAAPDVLRRGLYYAISCKVPNPSFANQTKTKVNNPELRGLAQRATTQMLEEFERRHGDEFSRIVEALTKELKADAAAERARKQVLDAQKDVEKNQKKKVFASDKLKDAEFLGQDSTLLIVEGDSALGGMSQARDYTRYGLLAVKGKILNCFSNQQERIFQNEEIKLILSALNIVPGKYDAKKLRYGKLGICVDSDSDGGHIALLLMCCMYYLAPEFIQEGRLCWLRSPLYIVENKGKESYYFSDAEFNKVRATIKGTVTRAKGLGELSPETAHASMFTPEFQRLDVLTPDDDTLDLLSQLMGSDSQPKSEFIFENLDFSEIKE